MWRKIYNYSRLWTICKNINFCGGSPSYIEDKNKEMLLITFPDRKFVFVEYIKGTMTCYVKSGHRDHITRWEEGLAVGCYKHSDGAMKNKIQKHIDKLKDLHI